EDHDPPARRVVDGREVAAGAGTRARREHGRPCRVAGEREGPCIAQEVTRELVSLEDHHAIAGRVIHRRVQGAPEVAEGAPDAVRRTGCQGRTGSRYHDERGQGEPGLVPIQTSVHAPLLDGEPWANITPAAGRVGSG